MVATEPTLERSRTFLPLELFVVATNPVLDIAIEHIRSFLLLKLFVVVTDLAIIFAFNRTLLNPCSLALVLNAALAIFILTLVSNYVLVVIL